MLRIILLSVVLVPFLSHAAESKKCSEENLLKLVKNFSYMSNQLAFDIAKRDSIVLQKTDSAKMKDEYVKELKTLAKASGEKFSKAVNEVEAIEKAYPECVFSEKASVSE